MNVRIAFEIGALLNQKCTTVIAVATLVMPTVTKKKLGQRLTITTAIALVGVL